jgi:hypothetical protein
MMHAFHNNCWGLAIVRIDRFIAEGGKGPYPDME